MAIDEDLPTIKYLSVELLGKSLIIIAAEAKAFVVSKANDGSSNSNKSSTTCTFRKKQWHEKDNCWKNHPKNVLWNLSTKTLPMILLSIKTLQMIRVFQKKKQKKKSFGGATFVRPLITMTSTLNTIKSWKYHNFWLSSSEASAQMRNFWAAFKDYRAHESPTDIQNMDGPVQAIGIGTAYV